MTSVAEPAALGIAAKVQRSASAAQKNDEQALSFSHASLFVDDEQRELLGIGCVPASNGPFN